jgi:uncharacterized protein
MAGASLLALLDDIASLLDDVSVMTKVAAKKTAGVLGDDLALNAQQVAGVQADRELPVVWAVAKGSLLNKAILVPSALAISAFASWAITPLLMLGGAYLCYEGVEKIAHRWLHPASEDAARIEVRRRALVDAAVDLVALEREKIRGAVRTDFILSAEIIAITLGVVASQPLPQQVGVLAGVALMMTVGVYGLVAGIVKLDDLGLALTRTSSRALQGVGRGVVALAPKLMKSLSIAGTAAMFLVGGGILVHGIPALGEALAHAVQTAVGTAPRWVATLASSLGDAAVGVVAGAAVLAVVLIATHLIRRGTAAA